MDPVTIACALFFELGTIWGFFCGSLFSFERVQNTLINGYATRTAIPIADEHISRLTIHSTSLQKTIARRLSWIIRAFVNTRAFELLILQKLGESWPGQGKINEKVRLIA